MPGAGERAYAYAKACGIVGKSFTGRRVAALGNVDRLSGLDRLIFPQTADLPEKELLKDIEKRISKRAVDAIRAVLKSFSKPPEFFTLLIRGWEFDDLKNAIAAAIDQSGSRPVFTDLGRFGTVNFAAWPDLDAMLIGTEFEYLIKMKNMGDIQTELDRHYYTALWKALHSLGRDDRLVSEKILAEEISLRNAAWAFRLRTYYQLSGNDIISHLVDINAVINGRKISLAADARSSLEIPLDNRQAWAGWKRARFLNPEGAPALPGHSARRSLSGAEWRVDPRYFQNAAAMYLYRLARHSFRTRPSSLDALFCFIKIIQFEEEALTSSAEGLGMGLSSREVFDLIGVEQL